MNATPTDLDALPPHRVRTVNVSINSANKIHDDETAARYGFRGGLVAGTLIHAHLTTPLVRHFGEAWLDRSVSELKLLQPAYDGEWLTVDVSPDSEADRSVWRGVVRNEANVELAVMHTSLPDELPPLDDRAGIGAAPDDTPVEPISWDRVRLNEPLRALRWAPTAEEHRSWCDAAGDDLPLYREGANPRIQPGLVLQGANRVFGNHFELAPWIHTGSRIIQRGPLRLGDPIEIRAVPIDKTERKGHEFVTLYVVFLNDGTPVVEIHHSAIFKVRQTAA